MLDPLDGRFDLAAYWGPREESLEACARRLTDCLHGLAEVSPVLDGWYRKGWSKRAASRHPVERSLEQMSALLDSGRMRRDSGGEVMPELGFHAALWNRRSVAWSVTCGGFPPPHVRVSNVFLIDWPTRPAERTLAEDLAIARAAMRVVLQAWAPDWATWVSGAMRDMQQSTFELPALGLLTYLGPQRGLPELGPGMSAERLGDGHLLELEPAGADLATRLMGARAALAGSGRP